MTLILIKTPAQGTVTKIALPSTQATQVEAKAHYTIANSLTAKALTSLQVVQLDSSLIIQQNIEGNNQTLIKIDCFFEEGIEASFATDGSEHLNNTDENCLITSSTPLSEPMLLNDNESIADTLEAFTANISDTILSLLTDDDIAMSEVTLAGDVSAHIGHYDSNRGEWL